MSHTSEPSSTPTLRRATPVAFAATSVAARSATSHPGSLGAASLRRGAVRGSRSEEAGGVPEAAGREARAT